MLFASAENSRKLRTQPAQALVDNEDGVLGLIVGERSSDSYCRLVVDTYISDIPMVNAYFS